MADALTMSREQFEERIAHFAEIETDLDDGIRHFVRTLYEAGIETFESCQGGVGHTYAEPAVRFHGEKSDGFRALAICMERGLPVSCLRRIWPVYDGEPHGPHWEITFWRCDPAANK